MSDTPEPRKRVRLVGATIHLAAVIDDGTTLEALPLDPINASASQLDHLAEYLVTAVANLENQLNPERIVLPGTEGQEPAPHP